MANFKPLKELLGSLRTRQTHKPPTSFRCLATCSRGMTVSKPNKYNSLLLMKRPTSFEYAEKVATKLAACQAKGQGFIKRCEERRQAMLPRGLRNLKPLNGP